MWPFDQNNQQVYQQYAQAYDSGNYNGLDPYQAFGHVQQFAQGAPIDMQQQVYQQHFAQMPYEQRALLAQRVPPQYGMDINNPWSMAQSFTRLGQEQPHLLPRIFDHPLLTGAGLALAALVARHMLNHHQRTMYGEQPQYGYNQGFQNQDQYLQQELVQERRQEQELRRELRQEERREERREERQEERREERREEREEHHHRHERDFF